MKTKKKNKTFNSIDEFVDALQQINFYLIKDIKVGEAIGDHFYYFNFNKVTLLQLIKQIISVSIKKYYFSSIYSDFYFLIAPDYDKRKDIINQIIKLSNCVEKSSIIKTHYTFPSMKRIMRLPLILIWFFQLYNMPLSNKYKLHLSILIYQAYCYSKEVIDYFLRFSIHPKLFVTICDAHSVEYFTTFYLKKNNIKTATLQHGVFTRADPYIFHFSYSDYFLAINKHTIDEMVASNYSNLKKVHVLGPIKFLDTRFRKEPSITSKNIVGLCLNGETKDNDNEKILKMIHTSSLLRKMKIYVRPHPSFSKKMIDELLAEYDCIICDSIDETIEKFSDRCDLVIVPASSSVFSDLICLNKISFRFINGRDLYPQLKCLAFHNKDDLEKLINMYYNSNVNKLIEQMADVRSYLLPGEDISKNYFDFFKEFLSKEYQ